MPIMQMNCVKCNTIYTGGIFPSRTTKYCSQKCMFPGFNPGYKKYECFTCKKSFQSKKRYRKYCSPKCIRYGGTKEQLLHRKGKGFWQIANEEQKKEHIKQSFERIVIKKNGCWEWSRKCHSNGYGTINMGRFKAILAHRASWLIHFGNIPDGLWVLHKCDNPPCTNPDHLFLGNAQDNVKDMIVKNRKTIIHGENHYSSKLTEDTVREIRRLTILKYSQSKLAKMFNVSSSCIQGVIDGKSWKHVQ